MNSGLSDCLQLKVGIFFEREIYFFLDTPTHLQSQACVHLCHIVIDDFRRRTTCNPKEKKSSSVPSQIEILKFRIQLKGKEDAKIFSKNYVDG